MQLTLRQTVSTSTALALATALLCAAPAPAQQRSVPLTFSGEVLYRMETTWQEVAGRDSILHRIGARFAVRVDVRDNLRATIGISTAGITPSSRLETLDNAFAAKPLALDLAYIAWRPVDHSLGFIGAGELWAGKMPNPLYRPGDNQLLWSDDVTPEGIAVVIGMPDNARPGVFLNATHFLIDHCQADADRRTTTFRFPRPSHSYASIYGVQGGSRIPLGSILGLREQLTVTLGGGYYHYRSGEERLLGMDFNTVEALSDIEFTVLNNTVTAFGNYVVNTAADDDNMAWIVGGHIARGPVTVGYSYRYIEKNAVPEPFTNPDFGTIVDAKGHAASVRWNVVSDVSLRCTAFFVDRWLDPSINVKQFRRMQADVIVSF